MNTQANTLEVKSLKNHFLVSMPTLQDDHFSHTITYLCDHGENGAMGIVINNLTGLKMKEVFEQMGIEFNTETGELPILTGGPVQPERGFVLHDGNTSYDTTVKVCKGVSLTASKDIIHAIAENKGPDNCLMSLGYAGWDSGQLEQEIADNAWLILPADIDILFNTPAEQRWSAATERLGFNLDLISTQAGHA